MATYGNGTISQAFYVVHNGEVTSNLDKYTVPAGSYAFVCRISNANFKMGIKRAGVGSSILPAAPSLVAESNFNNWVTLAPGDAVGIYSPSAGPDAGERLMVIQFSASS